MKPLSAHKMWRYINRKRVREFTYYGQMIQGMGIRNWEVIAELDFDGAFRSTLENKAQFMSNYKRLIEKKIASRRIAK